MTNNNGWDDLVLTHGKTIKPILAKNKLPGKEGAVPAPILTPIEKSFLAYTQQMVALDIPLFGVNEDETEEGGVGQGQQKSRSSTNQVMGRMFKIMGDCAEKWSGDEIHALPRNIPSGLYTWSHDLDMRDPNEMQAIMDTMDTDGIKTFIPGVVVQPGDGRALALIGSGGGILSELHEWVRNRFQPSSLACTFGGDMNSPGARCFFIASLMPSDIRRFVGLKEPPPSLIKLLARIRLLREKMDKA